MKLIQTQNISFLILAFFIGLSVTACTTVQEATVNEQQVKKGYDNQFIPLPRKLKRPVPDPIGYDIPNRFKQAMENGTRTATGKPGPDYWQQYSEYYIDVKILPNKKLLKASGRIVYHNNSPDTLQVLFLEIVQNYRDSEETKAVKMKRVIYDGHKLSAVQSPVGMDNAGYIIKGTLMRINPPQPLPPGQTATMKLKWSFKIPPSGASGRMGYSKDNLFFLAYWYPQMRVYDDVIGWFTAQFTGHEFYHGFADYEVSITVPEQWIVAATGIAQNRKELLKQDVYNRLMKAYEGTDIVRVVAPDDFGDVTIDVKDDWLTWEFKAERVNDFAFSVTKESIWEATTTPVNDRDGDGKTDYVKIDAFFRQLAPLWDDAARYAQHSIKFLSDFTGLNYPWPHMTAVEGAGIISGGMEYPMMTLIGPYNSRGAQPSDLYSVIAHELGHMWLPMQLATNERRYSWMDEGTTTFNEGQAQQDFPLNPDFQSEIKDFQVYLRIAGKDREGPIMRWSEYFYMGGYDIASYYKPASVLVALRGVLGKKVFMKAYHTFMERWQFKHPYPWDMFSTFEDVSNRNLDWFWRSWYYTTWVLDQAVGSVNQLANGVEIVIQDKGNIPMPATVKIWLSNGETLKRHIDVKTWLHGAVQTSLHVNTQADVKKVVIDPEHKFPDDDRSNNFWVNIDKNILKRYIGTYQISPGYTFDVYMKLKHLMIDPSSRLAKVFPVGGDEPTSIYPKTKTLFLIKGQTGSLEFVKNDRGKIKLIYHLRGMNMSAKKIK